MLTAATLGFAAYALYSVGLGLADTFGLYGLGWMVDVGLIVFGLLLLIASPLVRARLPGGLALAVGSLLALQALSLHNDTHFYGDVLIWPQVGRLLVAGGLVALAFFGDRAERASTTEASPTDPPTAPRP
jgi:hypothetical protein